MLRVYIADDSIGFGTLATAWLEQTDDLRVVGTARTKDIALIEIAQHEPDVVIVDRLLPQPEQSAEIMAFVRESLPAAALLLVSGMPDRHLADEARAAGADGHLSKAANAAGLADAVRRAAATRHAAGS